LLILNVPTDKLDRSIGLHGPIILMYKAAVYTLANGVITHQKQQI